MNTRTLSHIGSIKHLLKPSYYQNIQSKSRILFILSSFFAVQLFAYERINSILFGDDEKPVINIIIGNCEPAVINVTDNLCYGHLSIKAEATDNQTPKNDLVFTYKLDLYNDGIGPYQGYDFNVGPLTINEFSMGDTPLIHDNALADNQNNPFEASGAYPLGIHKICWYVIDSSGNEAALCELIEIKDCEAPTPYCLTGDITVPMPHTGCVTIWAKDLNHGSIDNCSKPEDLKFYFNGDPSAENLTICCADFVAAGASDELFVEVQLWVEDEGENTDYCKTLIIVLDNQNICPGDPPGSARVSGKIFSIRNRQDTTTVENVKIVISASGSPLGKELITKANGNYLFGSLPNDSYILSAVKNDQPFDYVSIYDIIRCQYHILGINSFDNPYQIVAADVNNSMAITASDISEMRKLILREIDQFNRVSSWLIFPIIDPPPMFPSTSIRFELKIGDRKEIDFRAIKMGDLNNLVSSKTDSLLLANPNDSLIFNIKNKSIKVGDTVIVDFHSSNFNDIIGYQFTVKFDIEHLKFIEHLENDLSTSKAGRFGFRYIDTGFITTAWVDLDLIYTTYKPDEVLFTFKFLATKDGSLCDLISITSDLTPQEAYRDSFLLENIKLDVCDMVISTKEETRELFITYPNPFHDEIIFRFSEKISFPVQIEIYSLNGKLLVSHQITSALKEFDYNAMLLNPGVYLMNMNDGKNMFYRKLFKY